MMQIGLERENRKQDITSKTPATNINWTTALVDRWTYEEERGLQHTLPSPYDNNKIGLRKKGLRFTHTQEEIDEYKKCGTDIVYFAEKYCVTMTDNGIKKVKLREYQKRILRDLVKYRFNIWVASRQIGKCFLGNTKLVTSEGEIDFIDLYYSYGKPRYIYKVKIFLYKILSKI